eukprot:1300460-Alexandrium_andersonii.AAC.1
MANQQLVNNPCQRLAPPYEIYTCALASSEELPTTHTASLLGVPSHSIQPGTQTQQRTCNGAESRWKHLYAISCRSLQ